MYQLSNRGFYEAPFCEVLDLIQERSFLDSNPYSSNYSANPHWGEPNGSSGDNLGGEGSSHIVL